MVLLPGGGGVAPGHRTTLSGITQDGYEPRTVVFHRLIHVQNPSGPPIPPPPGEEGPADDAPRCRRAQDIRRRTTAEALPRHGREGLGPSPGGLHKMWRSCLKREQKLRVSAVGADTSRMISCKSFGERRRGASHFVVDATSGGAYHILLQVISIILQSMLTLEEGMLTASPGVVPSVLLLAPGGCSVSPGGCSVPRPGAIGGWPSPGAEVPGEAFRRGSHMGALPFRTYFIRHFSWCQAPPVAGVVWTRRRASRGRAPETPAGGLRAQTPTPGGEGNAGGRLPWRAPGGRSRSAGRLTVCSDSSWPCAQAGLRP